MAQRGLCGHLSHVNPMSSHQEGREARGANGRDSRNEPRGRESPGVTSMQEAGRGEWGHQVSRRSWLWCPVQSSAWTLGHSPEMVTTGEHRTRDDPKPSTGLHKLSVPFRPAHHPCTPVQITVASGVSAGHLVTQEIAFRSPCTRLAHIVHRQCHLYRVLCVMTFFECGSTAQGWRLFGENPTHCLSLSPLKTAMASGSLKALKSGFLNKRTNAI